MRSCPALRGGIDPDRHDEEDRRQLGELQKLLGELARGGVDPVDVLDRDDDGASRGEAGDPRSVGPADLRRELVGWEPVHALGILGVELQ